MQHEIDTSGVQLAANRCTHAAGTAGDQRNTICHGYAAPRWMMRWAESWRQERPDGHQVGKILLDYHDRLRLYIGVPASNLSLNRPVQAPSELCSLRFSAAWLT